MAIMMGMVAFAVDIGYIAHAHTELQRTADAVALAAAAKLPDTSDATSAGITMASKNKTSISPDITSSNFEFGHWSRARSQFTTPTPSNRSTNAVRVTIRRTQANGNPLNLFYGRVLGRQTTDVTVRSIAFNDRGLCGPFVGIQSLQVQGDMRTDSFDSDDGAYDPATAGARGSVCSDGNITVQGGVEVHGDVRAGEGANINFQGSSATVTGSIGNRITPLDLPSVDGSSAQTSNNNASLPKVLRLNAQDNGKHWVNPLDQQGDFILNAGDVYTIPPGTYYFRDMKVNGGATLNISGPVYIYIERDLFVAGDAIVNNNTLDANCLQMFVLGISYIPGNPSDVDFTASTSFYGVIYAPDSDVRIGGGADFFGAAVGKTLTVAGNALGHYDESLDLELVDPPTRTTLVY